MKHSVQPRLVLIVALMVAAALCQGQTADTLEQQRQAAFALEQQGKTVEAESAWRAVLKTRPAYAEAYAHLGFLEGRQEHYKEAVPLYRKAFALDPAMPGLKMNLGLALFKSGALREAIDIFTPLLKSASPSSPEALRLTTLIGIARYGLGEYAAAVPALKEATAADPQDLPFRLMLAQSCLASKQYPCVLDTYHEILLLNAESAEADMLAGEAMDEMKDHAGAIQQFRAAVKADPKVPNVHFGLGYLLWSQGQYDEAAPEFQAELANVPDSVQAIAYLADAQVQLGNVDAARPLIERAIRLDSAMELPHLDLGILNADAGHREDALGELKIATKLNPNDVNAHWRLARLYQAMGRKDEAKVEFDKTSSLHKAENATIFEQLDRARAKGKPADGAEGAPANP
ncbi:tetratricopeptide repeat protein [Acidicapsa acidisoli]|uniref:tetratricopeptide repeat protein n=1 Tax=Acidicapsa acidisoli TaxID=1615681 RepID=UPI0021DFD665|nr:tetratricopeptide repeat protein [Acidicapsa acidisoli]